MDTETEKINYISIQLYVLQYLFMASTSTRQPEVGEGWVRKADNTYFIVVKIEPTTVTLISKAQLSFNRFRNDSVQLSLNRFRNDYSYKDKGVQAGEAWTYQRSDGHWVYEYTDGTTVQRRRRIGSNQNKVLVWETGLHSTLEMEGRTNYELISTLLRDYQHTASPLSGAASSSASTVQNDGPGGGGATSNATRQPEVGADSSDGDVVFLRVKEGKRKRETEAKLKKKGVCPVCQDDIFSNKEGNVFKDRIKQQNDGKLQIGYRTVKILKCCGNAIHYTCYSQWKENKTCPACVVDWNSLLDEDRVRDPEDVAIKSTEETVTVDTVVYRLSCQLKF